MSLLQRITLIITIIGAINWGIIGLFQYDVIAAIFGGQAGAIPRVIYTIVGISGLVCLSILFKPDAEFADRKDIEPKID